MTQEFKHSELKSGSCGKVKGHKQAIAIVLSDAGQSWFKTKAQNRRARAKTARQEATGCATRQEKGGRAKAPKSSGPANM